MAALAVFFCQFLQGFAQVLLELLDGSGHPHQVLEVSRELRTVSRVLYQPLNLQRVGEDGGEVGGGVEEWARHI